MNTPALSIPGGKYITRRDVIATTTTPGATIRYTTNGAEPTETDEAAPGNGLIVVDRSMTLRVKAFKSGIAPSPTAAGRYAITGAIQAGAAFMVGLKADKTVWAWGINNLGQLGRGNVVTPRTSPVQTPGLTDIEAIAVGANHVIALKTGGTLVGWGLNSSGQLGISNTSNRTSPVPIPSLSNVKAIAAGDNFSMALLGNGEVWTWGNNAFSQLADGTTSTRTTPIKSHYATTPTPVQIAAGNVFSIVRFDDGTVMASGAGALGATVATSVNPVSALLPAGVTEIFAGRGQTAFAVVTQGAATQLFGWGLDNQGQLGIGLPIGVEQTPLFIAIGKTQVGVGANQVIFGGFGAGLAGAGPASSGELGLGFSPILPASLSRMAPIPSAIQTIGLTAGANFSAALCIDGSVWTWGLGSNGQAGQGSTVNIFVPTRIAGFSLVSNTAATNDTDGDGLADGIEWAIGTDPQLADTNGDGIDDGAALLLGQSPTTLDSDGDGLTDAQEAIIGTNPYLADTDRDGVPDGLEAYPLDPTRSSNTPNPNDHTPPVITLLKPVTATPIP